MRRALNLADAFLEQAQPEDKVSLISGGVPIQQFDTAGINLLQLPPIKSDGTNFTKLLRDDDQQADAEYLEYRKNTLCQWISELNGDVVITELFPFGRRVLRNEFVAMLDLLSNQANSPLILASVRDVLAAPSKPAKARETEDILNHYYDAVLVHADPDVIELSASWPVTESIAGKLLYTGFVAQGSAPAVVEYNKNQDPCLAEPVENRQKDNDSYQGIVVSAGSGSVGAQVFETSIEAAAVRSDLSWRILVGGSNAETEIKRLQSLVSSDNVIIEGMRPDFLGLLATCKYSVSMCGYNTAIDLLQTGAAGLLVPFDKDGETEQSLRATCLAQLPGFKIVYSGDLTAKSLINAIEELEHSHSSARKMYQLNGASNSVELVKQLYKKHLDLH